MVWLQVVMPLLVCITGGVFALYQFHVNRKDSSIFKKLEEMQNNQQLFENRFEEFQKVANYDKLRSEISALDKRLELNDEITKRVELTLMIMYHPDQTMIIENLLEEYNGNHYIYTLAKEWADHYKVNINPRLLNKLCRNSSDMRDAGIMTKKII